MFFTLDIGTEVIAYPDTEARIGKGIVELRIESVGVAGPLHILHQKSLTFRLRFSLLPNIL